ncbi:MAG: acyl-CoA dehydrogenase family protein [Solirubrobacterales bacterium]
MLATLMYSFEIDPDYQQLLEWATTLVRDEVAPLDHVFPDPYERHDEAAMAAARPLMERVRERGLWACHLPPSLGGGGYGQVKLALLNEVLGGSRWAPTIFGCQAPDSGNAEILAHFGTPEQQRRYLQPLLDGEIVSCFAMTEPQGGSDPRLFTTTARRDGDGWVLDGEKWFASNATTADFFVVLAVTDADVPVHRGASMLIVPAATPGVEIVRDVHVFGEPAAAPGHAHLRFSDARLPAECLLGETGQAFAIAQTRLGGGRVHHAMRTVGAARQAFDAMCERAVSRPTRTGVLADYGQTQHAIAQSWIEIEQFRLLVLRTAWLIDKYDDYARVRKDIAAIKAAAPDVLRRVVRRAMHLHGSLGVSAEMPFGRLLLESEWLALVDGPTEVHETTIAKQVLADYEPAPDVFPSGHLPRLAEAAAAKLRQPTG